MRRYFLERDLGDQTNKTAIVLLPKRENAKSLKDYRPISLCNVRYKIIAKTLANRIGPLLHKFISPNQGAFIPGRRATDNIIVAKEIFGQMDQRRWKKRLGSLKVDIEKAYDTIRRPFLERWLLNLGFSRTMASIIMGCVTSTSFMIRVTGEFSEEFRAERGLRQGDPLSPYLYPICGEALTRVINHLGVVCRLPIPRIVQGGERVGTLQFADDLLIFFNASKKAAQTQSKTLDLFAKEAG